MKSLMIQGTSSWAGKSLLTTVLCRHFARLGVRVAPFKAQNMSNNARVVDGGEIGVAQYLQALAAGVEPDIRMNPVLVKPEGEMRSQVVTLGVADPMISAMPWRQRAPHLWTAAGAALESLMDQFDLVILEGAGSPAEINLADCDLANLRAAEAANAAVLLATDIDRGGAFAHLYGTWALMSPPDRGRIRGFILNKFRGDAALLAPAPQRLRELTGVPVMGVVPYLRHGLPDEDGAAQPPLPSGRATRVGIVRYPLASNLDEFKTLEQVAAVSWVGDPADLAEADILVLPGSKHVSHDLAWLRERGLAEAIRARAGAGGRVLGVCGGLQMLGEHLQPTAEGPGEPGLGLLPLSTVYATEKLVHRTEARFAAELPGPWEPLAGRALPGYEIRNGDTGASGLAAEALSGRRGWVDGPVLGITMHGLFEDPEILEAVFGRAPERTLDEAIDEVTDEVMATLDYGRIESIVAGVNAVRALR